MPQLFNTETFEIISELLFEDNFYDFFNIQNSFRALTCNDYLISSRDKEI